MLEPGVETLEARLGEGASSRKTSKSPSPVCQMTKHPPSFYFKSIFSSQLTDFRCVVARMLGLDTTNLAVADYEIIARIERIIASFNGVVLPVQVQSVVRIPTPTASISNHHQQTTCVKEDYSSTSSSASPSRHYHHRQRSPSPSRRSQHHHHHHHDSTSSSSVTRTRSNSPRKVTIVPNSY